MFTPYDWQEGIGNRAQYIEAKLAQGAPAIAVSTDEGILVFTYRRQARKIYEIYDRLIFAAVGQQSDIEALRSAAVEFAHQEGYNRSEQDVTIQRLVVALSGPLKKAFADFGTAPVVARSLFAEVNEAPEKDLFFTLDYDGDFAPYRNFAVVAGTPEMEKAFRERLADFKFKASADKVVEDLKDLWLSVQEREGNVQELPEDVSPEAILLERSNLRENRFRVLIREEF